MDGDNKNEVTQQHDQENDQGSQGNDENNQKNTSTSGSHQSTGDGQEGSHEGADGSDHENNRGDTVNRHKYEREMAAKDKQIEELKAQIAEASATKEGREKLEKRISDLEAQNKDDRVTYRLQLAGCRNVKAAKALLDDYDSDIDKLKAECDYLFTDSKKTGSTGGKPEGTASDIDDKLDRAFGFKKSKG